MNNVSNDSSFPVSSVIVEDDTAMTHAVEAPDKISEVPCFFSHETGAALFGVIYHPVGESDRMEGFVFVDAFAEEKLWAQRVMVSYARRLARLGYTVLRFDFRGHGDSDGRFEETSVSSRLADIRCAAGFLREQTGGRLQNINLLGLRFGATLALLAARDLPGVRRLVLWEPIINGTKYMKELLRSNLVTQTAVYKAIRFTRDDLVEQMKQGGTVNSEGYLLSYTLYAEAEAIDLLAAEGGTQAATLLVQIGSPGQPVKRDFVAMQERLARCRAVAVAEESFWKEIKTYYAEAGALFQETTAWLEGKS